MSHVSGTSLPWGGGGGGGRYATLHLDLTDRNSKLEVFMWVKVITPPSACTAVVVVCAKHHPAGRVLPAAQRSKADCSPTSEGCGRECYSGCSLELGICIFNDLGSRILALD